MRNDNFRFFSLKTYRYIDISAVSIGFSARIPYLWPQPDPNSPLNAPVD
jgi:hypothetical protein